MDITTNLEHFGYRERELLIEILQSMQKYGLPDDYNTKGLCIQFNPDSGYVFLTNEDLDVLMMKGDKLKQWFYCHDCGNEGFIQDCCLKGEGCNSCNDSL